MINDGERNEIKIARFYCEHANQLFYRRREIGGEQLTVQNSRSVHGEKTLATLNRVLELIGENEITIIVEKLIALDNELPAAPMIADIDDPETNHPCWTGKLYDSEEVDYPLFAMEEIEICELINLLLEARNIIPRLIEVLKVFG